MLHVQIYNSYINIYIQMNVDCVMLAYHIVLYRYWISIIYLGTLLLVMLMTTLVICFCARHYKAAFLVM